MYPLCMAQSSPVALMLTTEMPLPYVVADPRTPLPEIVAQAVQRSQKRALARQRYQERKERQRAACAEWLLIPDAQRVVSTKERKAARASIEAMRQRAGHCCLDSSDRRAPIEVDPSHVGPPALQGRSGYWTTPNGSLCQYPSAYRKAHGNPTYHCSTRRLVVSPLWILSRRKGVAP